MTTPKLWPVRWVLLAGINAPNLLAYVANISPEGLTHYLNELTPLLHTTSDEDARKDIYRFVWNALPLIKGKAHRAKSIELKAFYEQVHNEGMRVLNAAM